MRIDPNPQGSEGWKQARLGILTASDFSRLLTPKTRKPSASAAGLVAEKAAEWAIGEPIDDFSSGMTDRGNEIEQEAANRYALETDADPEPVGLCLLDDLPIGASPDRLVGDDGILEIKCPGPKAMVAYLLDHEALREEYVCQVQGQLWISGRSWCDLYAYNEMFPAVRVRCPRDEEFIAALAAATRRAAEILEDAKASLRAMGVHSPLEIEPCAPREPSADTVAAFEAMLANNAMPPPERVPAAPPAEIPEDRLPF